MIAKSEAKNEGGENTHEQPQSITQSVIENNLPQNNDYFYEIDEAVPKVQEPEIVLFHLRDEKKQGTLSSLSQIVKSQTVPGIHLVYHKSSTISTRVVTESKIPSKPQRDKRQPQCTEE